MISYFEKFWAQNKEMEMRDKILIATLFCYAVGFIITNLYLGSLGVIRMDILRVKYITTSLLFGVYYAAIIIPFRGYLKIIREHHTFGFKMLMKIIIHSFECYVVLIFVTSVLAILGGSQQLFSTTVKTVSHSFLDTIYPLAWNFLRLIAVVGIFCFFVFVVICIIAFFVSWVRKTLPEFWGWFRNKNNYLEIARGILVVCTMPVIFAIPLIVFGFSFANVIPHVPWMTIPTGWDRFLHTAFGWYALGAGIVFIFSFQRVADKIAVDDKDDWSKTIDPNIGKIRNFVVDAMILFLILGIYSLYVFPALPQQIGGAKDVPVVFTSSNKSIVELLQSSSGSYLIDRSDDSSIFKIVLQNPHNSFSIVELSNDNIDFIEYKDHKNPIVNY